VWLRCGLLGSPNQSARAAQSMPSGQAREEKTRVWTRGAAFDEAKYECFDGCAFLNDVALDLEAQVSSFDC